MSVDPLTGALKVEVPVKVSPGRHGFTPDLTLRYDSSDCDGGFGLGWKMATASISRRTATDVPRYLEADDGDVFEVDDDELVPALRVSGGWIDDRSTVGEYVIQRYRRRYEQQHDRIERWVHQPSGQTYWRTIDANNVTSLFGSNDDSRISDPTDPTRILTWLLAERYDDRGNIIRYSYKHEDLAGVDLDAPSESHRRGKSYGEGGMRYLKRIQYANTSPHERSGWCFEVVLDYGDHDLVNPKIEPDRQWDAQPDPYSSFRSGFEMRAWRRCRRVLMFHNFDDLGPDPYLVSATRFQYDDSAGRSLLASVRHTGFIHRNGGVVERRSIPPVTFAYEQGEQDTAVHVVDADGVVNALVDEGARARWVDLHDEGLPGVLSRLGESWFYLRNLGNGRFAEPEIVADVASQDELDAAEVIDLSAYEPRLTAPAHEREYQPMTTLRGTANVNQDDPYVGYLDLNGDDADDVVVADERIIRWYPSQGEEGFGDPVVLRIDASKSSKSRLLHSDENQSFHVADMNGDSMLDLVRVRSGEVSYWPNCGRGRFGDRVVVAGAPELPADTAGNGHIILADVTGSGTTDLIWVGGGELHYWENYGGNRFGELVRIEATGIHPGAPGLAAVDLLGNGAACVVWIDNSNGPAALSYVQPAAGRRQGLLVGTSNNRGLDVRASYASSTQFWLRDRADGGAWLTAIPVPVHVVERLEARDRVAETRTLSRFAYHHGYYDTAENVFAGFAFTERWDSGNDDEYSIPGLFPSEPVPAFDPSRRPAPLLTKTWHHTGTQFEDSDLSVALKDEFFSDPHLSRRKWLSSNQMPLGQQARDIPRGHRALRGQLIRRETFGVDGPPLQDVPFQVWERTAWVRQVQPGRSGKPPVYDVRENESVEVLYERDANDPRIKHRITLSLDDFGVVTRQADIAYGRRQPQHASQAASIVTVTERTVINKEDQSTWHRIQIPVEHKVWQLVSAAPMVSTLFEPREIRAAFEELPEVDPLIRSQGAQKRLVAGTRHRYWSNDLSKLLDVGVVESRALLARTEELALTSAAVDARYGDESVAALRFEGGYEIADQLWWAPGPTVRYDAAHFYVGIGKRDAVGRETILRWNKQYLAVEKTEDPFGNVTTAETHPRVLRSWSDTDVNHNVVARRFDPLGMVISEAAIGKPANHEGDILALTGIESSAHDNPTIVTTYDLEAWAANGRPTWIRTRHRTLNRSASTGVEDQVVSYDGVGCVLGAANRSGGSEWLLTEFVERDGNGLVTRRAEPFVSDVTLPDPKHLRDALYAGTRFTRDALGRVVRTDFPDGTFTVDRFGPWGVVRADQSDNVLDSAWYAERQVATQGRAGDFAARQAAGANYDMRSAALAAAHARTPKIELFDALGNVVVEILDVGGQQNIERVIDRDCFGRQVAVTDGRGIRSSRIHRDLMGRVIAEDDADAGSSVQMLAVTGETLRSTDGSGHSVRYRYDAMGRVTHVLTKGDGDVERLVERIVYGGGDIAVSNAAERNLIGRPHLHLSTAGLETIEACDFNGNVTRSAFYPLSNDVETPDWASVSDLAHSGQLVPQLAHSDNPTLDNEPLTIESTFDALGRLIEAVGLGGARIEHGYGRHGRVASIQVGSGGSTNTLVEALTSIELDAHGRITEQHLGNGVKVLRSLDLGGHVSELVSSAADGEALVNLRISRDTQGNAMSVTSAGDLVSSFTYDSLGRLLRAEGVEPGTPGENVGHFVNTYALDAESNLVEVAHKSPKGEFTRRFAYEAESNRVKASSTPEDVPGAYSSPYSHNECGQMTHTPRPQDMRWDYRGRLAEVELSTGVRVRYSYTSAGAIAVRNSERPGVVRDETVVLGPFERRRRYQQGVIVFEQYSVTATHEGLPLAVGERTTVQGDMPRNDSDAIVRYQLLDHVGSVLFELSGTGDLITEESYLPFGVSSYRTGRTSVELATKKYGFRSGRLDIDADMLCFAGRWYSPLLGRWLDAAKVSGSTNPYVFANANPQRDVNTNDPTSAIRERLLAIAQQNLALLLG